MVYGYVDSPQIGQLSRYVREWEAGPDDTAPEVNLFELRGGQRFAVDTVGAVAGAGRWQRLDVSHDTHRPGATLALEILAPTLRRGTTLLVDDLTVRASSSPMKTH